MRRCRIELILYCFILITLRKSKDMFTPNFKHLGQACPMKAIVRKSWLMGVQSGKGRSTSTRK